MYCALVSGYSCASPAAEDCDNRLRYSFEKMEKGMGE